MKLNELKVGDKVEVASAWGRGPIHVGTIQDVLDDVKNGREGIDYVTEHGVNHWAYIDQVIKKLAK